MTATATRPADPDLTNNTDTHTTTVAAPAADLSVDLSADCVH